MDLFLFTNRIKEIEDTGINVDLMFDGMEDKVTITMSKDDHHVRKTFIDLTYTKDNRYIDFELDLMVQELVRMEEEVNKPKEPEAFNNKIDVDTIHKIIDDAMEKKDRSVSLFINEDGMSVNVYPYETGLQTWVTTYEDTGVPCFTRPKHSCPNCGSPSERLTPYCPYCGEQLKMEVKE